MSRNDNLPATVQSAALDRPQAYSLWIPRLIEDAGPEATRRFVEFFAVPLSNRNTRMAYLRAVRPFLDWCEQRGLGEIAPIHLAAYREQHTGSLPTIKQHFSALRMLFGWLVEKGILSANPAREVKTEKFQRGEGKTPALCVEEMQTLFASFDTQSVVGLRDRALVGVMTFTFARIEAVVSLKVKDYFQNGRRSFVRLSEKGGKHKEIPAHHQQEEYLDAYIEAAEIGADREGPLFRSAVGKTRKLTDRPMRRTDAWAMVRRRVGDAGLIGDYSCHSFWATGITTFLENGGNLETAQYLAGHADSRTTKLYDRRAQRITREDVERIRY